VCKPSNGGVNIRKLEWLAVVYGIISVTVSVVPVLPDENLKNIFRSKFVLSSRNPFILTKKGLTQYEQLTKMHKVYFSSNPSTLTTTEMVEDLKNITTKQELFKFVDFHFYGYSPLCTKSLFEENSLKSYDKAYLAIISTLLIIITVALLFLISNYTRHRSSLKTIMTLGVQLVCWFSYLGAKAYFTVSNNPAPVDIEEYLFLLILPLCSLLHPIIRMKNILNPIKWLKRKQERKNSGRDFKLRRIGASRAETSTEITEDTIKNPSAPTAELSSEDEAGARVKHTGEKSDDHLDKNMEKLMTIVELIKGNEICTHGKC
jgi:hypothetical protein